MGTHQTSRSSGFTLIELMISSTIAIGLLYAVATTALTATNAYDTTMRRSRLVARAHQVLDRIADDFVEADLGTVTPAVPGFGASTITYRKPDTVVGSVVTWGNYRSISFQMDQGETDDGLDNNGDGRIDEGVVVLTIDVGLVSQQQVTMCHEVRSMLEGELSNLGDDNGNLMVDERGLVFELNGDILTVRLTLENIDEDGNLLTKSVQTSVRVRSEFAIDHG